MNKKPQNSKGSRGSARIHRGNERGRTYRGWGRDSANCITLLHEVLKVHWPKQLTCCKLAPIMAMAFQSWTSSVRRAAWKLKARRVKAKKSTTVTTVLVCFVSSQPRPKPTACFSHLFGQEKRFKTKLRRGFCCCKSRTLCSLPKPWKLYPTKFLRTAFLSKCDCTFSPVLVDNDVFARGIIWKDLPRIKWTVIEAFETMYSYATVMLYHVAFRISAGDCRSCSNLGTLLQMSCELQTLAQSKPLLQLNSNFGGASYPIQAAAVLKTNYNLAR